jgi:putative component of membrane protein insertase Oxa1/YidC/SpoIIIJ protein YidD
MPLSHKTLLIVFALLPNYLYAQQKQIVQEQVINQLFNDFKLPQKQKRPFLKPDASLAVKLNPLTYVSGGLLYVYQNIISEHIQADCQYHISCSENMKQSIKKRGFFVGILNGLNQLSNCGGNITQDYPTYKITSLGKINNAIE